MDDSVSVSSYFLSIVTHYVVFVFVSLYLLQVAHYIVLLSLFADNSSPILYIAAMALKYIMTVFLHVGSKLIFFYSI